MEALFSGFHVSDVLVYRPPMPPHNPNHDRGTGSAKTRGWSKTTRVFLVLSGPPAPAQHVERTNTTPDPPMSQKTGVKTQKHRRCRRNVLRRFLVTSAMIGRNSAPDFNGAHPQGVQWDSLGSFRAVGQGQWVDTPMLRAFFARAASAII